MCDMKKVLSLFIVISLFIFMPVVKAENFSRFTIRTSVSNSININELSSIIVYMALPGEDDFREIELNRRDLFNYETFDMPDGSEFDNAIVYGDKIGKYNIKGELTKKEGPNVATLYLTVHLNGENPMITTTTTTTTTTKSQQVVADDDIIIVDDDGNVKTTASTDVPTVVITSSQSSISNAARNRLELYKYVLMIVVALLVIVGLMIVVKIIRTANLM
jgi:hypothetical protein